MTLLVKHGIAAPGKVVSLEEALKLPRPAVLKADTKEHKTDKNLVFVGLRTDEEIRTAYKKLSGKFDVFGQPEIRGFEFVLGALRDPDFGKVVMFGAGGTYAELFEDVVFRSVPLSRKEAEEMIEEPNVSKVFSGFRGMMPDRGAVVETLLKFSRLYESMNFKEADLNPVIANDSGAFVVDARVIM